MNPIVIVLITKFFIISAKSAKDIQRIADSGFNYYNIQHQDDTEKFLPNGNGSVRGWINRVQGLETWERELKLGDAYLQTSAKSQTARARFTLGLLCLHSFMYDHAIEFFEKAQSDELSFSGRQYPMAIWGAAMSTKWMLWQASNCDKGKQYLQKISEDIDWLSELEKELIETAFALYPKNKECKDDTEYQREKRFTSAMEKVMFDFPDEVEAKLFYGLSKAATLSHGECSQGALTRIDCKQDLENIRLLLQDIEEKHPTHPGVIHYIIHLFDTPDVFIEGNKKFIHEMVVPEDQKDHEAMPAINAAYNYLNVGASSCHGLHMSAHIFMRLGSWKMSLKSNMMSIQACDEYAKMRGYNHTYDAENLYHSIEFAQYDSLQLGQYSNADRLLERMEDAVQSYMFDNRFKDRSTSRKKTEGRTWELYRMYARQLIEAYDVAPKFVRYSLPQPYGCISDHPINETSEQYKFSRPCSRNNLAYSTNPELNLPPSVLRQDLPDGRMNYAALAEGGALLITGLSSAKNYASDTTLNGTEEVLLKMCIDGLNLLSDNIEPRKGTMDYVKFAIQMFREILLGIQDLAEIVKPYGFDCFISKSCPIMKEKKEFNKIRKLVLGGHLNSATMIQAKHMIQSPATPTLLFMPSYEVYGHVLLLLDLKEDAKEMFEKALLERMGRVQSLVGLARAHAALGNDKEANYFYDYLKTQLDEADENNPLLEEAKLGTKSKIDLEVLREQWRWPYL